MKKSISRRKFIAAVSAAPLALGTSSVLGQSVLMPQSLTTTALQNPSLAAQKAAIRYSKAAVLGARTLNKNTFNGLVSLEITLGLKDEDSTDWSGRLELSSGRIYDASLLDLWPSNNESSFKINANQLNWEGGSVREPNPDWVKGINSRMPGHIPEVHDFSPIQPHTFLVTLADAEGEVSFYTKDHGSFSFSLAEIDFGRTARFLNGQVSVRRAVPSREIMELDNSELPTLYNDFPSICKTSDGSTYTVFVSFIGSDSEILESGRTPNWTGDFDDLTLLKTPLGRDQLMMVHEKNGKYAPPQQLTESGKSIFGAQIAADSNDRLWIVWSEKGESGWDVFLMHSEANGWSAPRKLSEGVYPDMHPAIAADNQGKVHIAWQGFSKKSDGLVTSDILYTQADSGSGALSKPVKVSQTGGNNWMPALAVSKQGKVALVWDTYEKGDYDVYYSLLQSSGRFGESLPVAASRKYEANPTAVFDKDERLWIAYEEADENWGKDVGDESNITKRAVNLSMGRTIKLKCFDKGQVYESAIQASEVIPLEAGDTWYYKLFQNPNEYFRDTKPNHRLHLPVLIQDPKGGIVLIYKKQLLTGRSVGHSVAFANYFMRFDGLRWTEPSMLTHSEGHSYQRASAVPVGDGFAVVSAGDMCASVGWDDIYRTHNIRMSKVEFADETGDFRLYSLDEVTPHVPAKAILEEKEAVALIRDFTSKVGNKELKIYRGDTHRHTTFSRDGGNDGSILDCMRYALDVAALEWLSNGDHDNGNCREFTWYTTQKFHSVFDLKGHFMSMQGYERSVTFPRGHRNIIMAEDGYSVVPREPGRREDRLYRFCREHNAVTIAHTTATGGAGTDWSFNDPVAEPVLEIYQGCRNSYEYPGAPRNNVPNSNAPGFYWNALEKGFKMGIIASSDHKSTHCSYAMVYLQEPTKKAILEALRQRHSYGATDNILLEVKMGDKMMGDIFESSIAAALDIYVVGTDRVQQIDIIKNCKIVDTLKPAQKEVRLNWKDSAHGEQKENHYYVRIMQEDGELAWSSPMWITYV